MPCGQGPQVDPLAQIGEVRQVIGPLPVQVVQRDLARRVLDLVLADLLDQFVVALLGPLGELVSGEILGQHLLAGVEQDRPLLSGQPVVRPRRTVQLGVRAVRHALGVLERPDRLAVGESSVLVRRRP